MYLDGFQQGMLYDALESCIHVGIMNYNLLQESGFYHRFRLTNEKTGEVYSDKLQFHVIQLKQLDKEPEEKDKELYQWAKLIAAKKWEVASMTAKGNSYMETAMDAMVQINMNPTERYRYLRRQLAETDKINNLWWAEKKGREEGLQKGRERVNQLNLILLKENRQEDLLRSLEDTEFQDELFRQYNL